MSFKVLATSEPQISIENRKLEMTSWVGVMSCLKWSLFSFTVIISVSLSLLLSHNCGVCFSICITDSIILPLPYFHSLSLTLPITSPLSNSMSSWELPMIDMLLWEE